MRKPFRKFLLSLVLLLAADSLHAQAATVPGDVLAMLRPGVDPKAVAADLARAYGTATGLLVGREVSAPMRTWLFQFDPGTLGQEAMLRAFRAHPGVELAQGNHVLKERQTTPDDPLFAQQWWHQNIQSELAWDISTGGVTAEGDTIVVAIIEQADLAHPDLAANAWINRGEIPGNGIDDDGNGYVDDVRGWNPEGADDNVYGGSHGTRVAGMIGAAGNNGSQVAGTNWHVKMMPVTYKNMQEDQVLASYTYPLVMRRLYNGTGGSKGAFVVATNASWGQDGGQPANAPIWCALYDTLGAAGVLNCASTTNNNVDVDLVGDLPTACPSEYLISVTATNGSDNRTSSGYGATTVDLGAPGQNVLTTTLGGGTGITSGTSFASPLTAGVVALMYSVPCTSLSALAHHDPPEAARRVRDALFNGVDHVGNLGGQTVTGGRVNSFNSLQLLLDSCHACLPPYGLSAGSGAIGSAVISWNALPGGEYRLRYRPAGTSVWTLVSGITDHAATITGLDACRAYELQVAADCADGPSYWSTLLWTSEGCCSVPSVITAEALDTTSAAVFWSTVLASEAYDLRYRRTGAGEWTELHGLTGNSATLSGLMPCSDIEIQMGSTCGANGSPWSASVQMHVPGCGQCVEGPFCGSRGESTAYEWIAQVNLNGINRLSGNDGGYADIDVTAQSADLVIGDTYPVLLKPGYALFAYQESFTVWLDLDRDGQFSADELLFSGVTSDPDQPLAGTITIPGTAHPGSLRMRVLMKDTSPPATGCTVYAYGETEDYCIRLNLPIGVDSHAPPAPLHLFPQPADQVLHVAGLPSSGLLSVSDMTGRLVLQQDLPVGGTTLATGAWDAGLYQYRLVHEGLVTARGGFLVVH